MGNKLAQLETWLLVDRLVLEHNALAAVGPNDWLELAMGVVHGGVLTGPEPGYSITGPILQAKALLLPARNNSWPGLAVAAGVLPPLGHGAFTPPSWGGFGSLAATASLFDEWLLVHANLGIALGDDESARASALGPGDASRGRLRSLVTAGLAVQARLVAGLHALGEVYRGDPYDPETNFPAMQLGLRYVFSDHVQSDASFGTTLTEVGGLDGSARTEQWGTLGVRLVTGELW